MDNVSNISKEFSAKIGLTMAGELLGLLHDLGKYSDAFQNYLSSSNIKNKPYSKIIKNIIKIHQLNSRMNIVVGKMLNFLSLRKMSY